MNLKQSKTLPRKLMVLTRSTNLYVCAWNGNEWVLWLTPSSFGDVHLTAESALRAIHKHAKSRKVDIHVGTIEWINVPHGFNPPTISN